MDRKLLTGMYKRFFITFACLLPLLIYLGILLGGHVTNFVRIAIFTLIGGTAFLIEEIINSKLQERRQKKREAFKTKNAKNGSKK